MTQDIRIAVVGTGYMAQTMIAAIRNVRGLHVTSLCSRDKQRAQLIANSLGIDTAYGSLEELLADLATDAVYICNETAAHADVAIRALEAGKAVLCEKPLAMNAVQAEAIAATARRSGRLFMEAIATPFVPAVRSALEKAASGTLGAVRHLTADFGYPATPISHPGCYAAMGGGVLLDRATYVVTLARLALGPVESVRAEIARDANGIDVEASILLQHRGGAISQLAASLTSMLGNRMTISGTQGAATVCSPLLAAERIFVERAPTPQRPLPLGRIRKLLKENGGVRRVAGLLRGGSRYVPLGPTPYSHELLHFRDLYHANVVESPVLPMSVSLDVMRVLHTARECA